MSCSASSPAAEIGAGRTLADLDRWLAAMPEEARWMLAQGPFEDVIGGCGICRMLWRFEPPDSRRGPDWLEEMWEWHGAASRDDLARYLLCVLVYVSAGWEGYV